MKGWLIFMLLSHTLIFICQFAEKLYFGAALWQKGPIWYCPFKNRWGYGTYSNSDWSIFCQGNSHWLLQMTVFYCCIFTHTTLSGSRVGFWSMLVIWLLQLHLQMRLDVWILLIDTSIVNVWSACYKLIRSLSCFIVFVNTSTLSIPLGFESHVWYICCEGGFSWKNSCTIHKRWWSAHQPAWYAVHVVRTSLTFDLVIHIKFCVLDLLSVFE